MVASQQIVCDGSRIVAVSSFGEMLLTSHGLSSRNYTTPEMVELAHGLHSGNLAPETPIICVFQSHGRNQDVGRKTVSEVQEGYPRMGHVNEVHFLP